MWMMDARHAEMHIRLSVLRETSTVTRRSSVWISSSRSTCDQHRGASSASATRFFTGKEHESTSHPLRWRQVMNSEYGGMAGCS